MSRSPPLATSPECECRIGASRPGGRALGDLALSDPLREDAREAVVALRRIRQNLGFALAYNAVAVPLAAAGWLDPLPAALAMSLSSLVLTGNAVRLLRWRPVARAA